MLHISPNELKEKLAGDSGIFLLDVREEWEHEDFNIGGLNIPLSEVLAAADRLPRDRTVVVYCRKGVRSQIAIQRLEDKFGFSNLVNLEGGVEQLRK